MAFRLGVLMLDNRFPRPVGDIGNEGTFPFEVVYRRVSGARVERVVTGQGIAPDLLEDFKSNARELERQGCDLITTGCGFLLPHQRDLAAAVGVPVITSSLCVLPYLLAIKPPGGRIAVLTYNSVKLRETLGPDAPEDLLIEGIEGGRELHRVIAEDLDALDVEAARADVRAAAETLKTQAENLSAVVLECTNLPPYRDAIEDTVGCPVYDIRDLVHWHAGLAPPA